MSKLRFAWVSLALVLIIADASRAYLINNVVVSPALPTPATPVSFSVMMTTPSSPPYLFSPTTTQFNGNNIAVGVFLDSGPLTVLDSLTEVVPLGPLANGTYNYTVTLTPAMDFPFGRGMRVVSGSFEVVPEPTSLLLGIVAAMTMLPGRRRR